MADASQIRALIKGFLVDLEIPYQEAQDGSDVRVLIGSTAVYIRSYQWDSHTVVQFEAPVLFNVSEDAPIAMLPMLNRQLYFAKFGFDADNSMITVDYELLAAHMDVDEFYNALVAVGTVADDWDDRLQGDFGGDLHSPDDGDDSEDL